jgi:hypothetical protein
MRDWEKDAHADVELELTSASIIQERPLAATPEAA